MTWLAIDVGGANLKVADGLKYAHSVPFPLWRDPAALTAKLRELIAQAPPCDHLAVTMTGELCDCFPNKTVGVLAILDAVESVAAGRHTRIYLTDGRLLSLPAARRVPLLCAASNWHALARFASRMLNGTETGLLLDIGSTTTDVIPLDASGPYTTSLTDLQRLVARELCYAGVIRTPLCAVCHEVDYRGTMCPIAREWFATTRDVYTILGDLPEDPSDVDTPDGRPAMRIASRSRLGRQICADESEFHHRDAIILARSVRAAQVALIYSNMRHVAGTLAQVPSVVVTSGVGEFLARRCLQRQEWPVRIDSFSNKWGPRISAAATAYALAVLARSGQQEPMSSTGRASSP